MDRDLEAERASERGGSSEAVKAAESGELATIDVAHARASACEPDGTSELAVSIVTLMSSCSPECAEPSASAEMRARARPTRGAPAGRRS